MTPSRPILDADYSSVEARIVCWLSGQEDALQEYMDGVDRYKGMASFIYGVPESQVNSYPQRFVGKQAILGCGFGMGPDKFRATCWKMGRYVLPLGLEFKAIQTFRARHQKITEHWKATERAAKKAILDKNQIITLRNIAYVHTDIKGMPFLLVKLPSGRKLAYPRPRISNNRIIFFGQKGVTKQWGDVETYGGKILENITQAVSSDITCIGSQNAENAGFEIFALIHDQALSYAVPGKTPEEFNQCLVTLPNWADGLPVEAKGDYAPFYRKD